MDISQLPSIFFPLCLICFLLFSRAAKKGSGQTQTPPASSSSSSSSSSQHSMNINPLLLILMCGGLGLMGFIYSFVRNQHISSHNVPMDGCILITGASKGIGRALILELASRYPSKCILLTSRKPNPLDDDIDLSNVVNDLKTKYDATNVTILDKSIDLSQDGSAKLLYDYTTSHNYNVDMLILNAGIGSSGKHNDHTLLQISNMLQLNVVQNTMLLQQYANDMISNKNGGRILIVSSLTGAVNGLPNAAMYGATKAYLRSIGWGLEGELTKHNIGITVSLPGATADTKFAETSDMSNAVVWNYPMVVSDTVSVARQSIDALIHGQMEVYPGRFLDSVTIRVVSPLVPPRFLTWFFGMSWEPWPYNFPPGWKKSEVKKKDRGSSTSEEDNKEL